MQQTDLLILQGKTFLKLIRWETSPIVYKPISAISQAAPVRLTVIDHGIPDQWRAAVVSVVGMVEINAQHAPPAAHDYKKVTLIDVDTVEFNDINASEFTKYVSGGYLQYNTPADLNGVSARMTIKDRVGGEEILSLSTTNGMIKIDDVAKTITLEIDADTTALITAQRGVYDLEMIGAAGVVTQLLCGYVNIVREVTT